MPSPPSGDAAASLDPATNSITSSFPAETEPPRSLLIAWLSPPQTARGTVCWIAVALVVKAAYAVAFVLQSTASASARGSGLWARIAGDTSSYLDPIDSLLRGTGYQPDLRMPGYGAVYLLLRVVGLARLHALNFLVVLQVIVGALSVYALAMFAKRIWRSDRIFAPVFFGAAVSTFVSIYDVFLLTESFSTSALIFALYFALRAAEEQRSLLAFASGAFLTWAIFLRPILVPLLVVVLLLLVFGFGRPNARTTPRIVAVALIPLFLCEGAWIVRNEIVHRRLLPLATSLIYPSFSDLDRSLFRFQQAWGGSIVFWDPRAEIVWFEHRAASTEGYQVPRSAIDQVSFPADIFTSQFSMASLIEVKQRIQRAKNPALPVGVRSDLLHSITRDLDRYSESIRIERPIVYYVVAPLRLLRKHLLHSGTSNLLPKAAADLNLPELAFKLAMSALYLAVVLFGAIGVLVTLAFDIAVNPRRWILAIAPVYIVLAHTVIMRASEYRYFAPAYPLFLCFAIRVFALGLRPLTARRFALRL